MTIRGISNRLNDDGPPRFKKANVNQPSVHDRERSTLEEYVAIAIDIGVLKRQNSPLLTAAKSGEYPPSNISLNVARDAISAVRKYDSSST